MIREFNEQRFEEVSELLRTLADIQNRIGTGPIELSIGRINNRGLIKFYTVVLKKTPAIVIEKLVHAGWIITIKPDGAHVSKKWSYRH